MRLHPDEPPIDVDLVARLLASQHPAFTHLPLRAFDSPGTTNTIFRLGDELLVRLPRRASGVDELHKSFAWLPRLAPRLSVQLPVPVARGEPGEGYPWPWSIAPWIEGANVAVEHVLDPRQAAQDLASFLHELHAIDASAGPRAADLGMRSASLQFADAEVRASIDALPEDLDRDAIRAVWDAALELPGWNRAPVWSHGDLGPDNILWKDGRLVAVIDYGALAVGDPACDLMIGWSQLRGSGRDAFREALEADDPLWLRGRAYALAQAVIYIPYYLHTRPRGVAVARRMLDAVMADERGER
ncbi:MAG: aminoglycoside phosphotransferase family protein [Planctomycetes bacterium]|nr:aminoglycoside phosphotransferase family protein [Planctomycetota bacterium]